MKITDSAAHAPFGGGAWNRDDTGLYIHYGFGAIDATVWQDETDGTWGAYVTGRHRQVVISGAKTQIDAMDAAREYVLFMVRGVIDDLTIATPLVARGSNAD